MHEVLEGRGKLLSRENAQEYQVTYHFDIVTHVVEQPGFPRVASHNSGEGTVQSMDGHVLPEGYYDLHTEDEVLHVKNLGVWVILS